MERRSRSNAQPPTTRPPRFLTLFCAAVVLLVGVMSFGTYVNDEAAQLQGLHNLRQGSWEVEDRPRHFYAPFEGAFLPGVDDPAQPNMLVSLVSLPAYWLLRVLSPLASPPTLLLLGWAAAAHVAVTRGVSRLHVARTGRPWRWTQPVEPREDPDEARPGAWTRAVDRVRSMTPSHWALVGGLALWVLAQWAQTRPVDYGTWGETFAVQTTHVLLSALGAALFYRVVEHETGSLAVAGFASLALLAGPYTAWGFGIKYHALSAALAVATMRLYQRDDRWRLAAYATAALGVALTPLGAPLLAALVTVDLVRGVRLARRGEARPLRLAVAAAVAGAVLVLVFNRVVLGDWLGVVGPALADGDAWAGLLEALRFEGVGRSLRNLWGVLVDGSSIEGQPVAMLALTPLAALALFAPARLRGAWTRTTALAALGVLLFFAVIVHSAHTQGDGRDNRFFHALLPLLVLLAAVVVARRTRDMELARWRPGRHYAVLLAAALVVLAFLAAAGVALDPERPTRQLLAASWLLGTVAWLAGVALEGLHGALERRRGADGVERAWTWLLPAMLVPGTLWLLHVVVLTNRVIPPWPFGSDRAGISFLMPTLDAVREALLEFVPV